MAYTSYKNGLNVQTASAIDRRIYLTKAEMLTAEDVYMLPDVYFCICPDDGKFYIFNVNNEINSITGKYRPLDEIITSSESFTDTVSEAIKNSVDIVNLKDDVSELQSDVSAVATELAALEEIVDSLEADGGLIK